MEALSYSVIVYRAMSRKGWIDKTTKHPLPAAFMRWPAPDDADGLSVDIESARSCLKPFLRPCFGIASLYVGEVRDLGLDVIVDDAPHANISGLPREEDDRTEANRLASLLAKQARLVPPEQCGIGVEDK